MALGLINLNIKDDLLKLSKDELINLVIDKSQEIKNFMDKIIDYSEEELLEFQKELKAIKEAAKVFVAISGGHIDG